MIPGEILAGDGDITINPDRPVRHLTVRNTGDRPVQVGSHYHFAESNAALDFDRDAAWGYRLAVPSGTSVRFEPGLPREVTLVPLSGRRIVPGLRGLAGGPLDPSPRDDIEPAGALDEELPGNGHGEATGRPDAPGDLPENGSSR
ncbi:urease subunit beta [Couchioplanes azureus]|uniref:urease subunit beta n=1 Tax=Couchioplanes caeruleus TaxID=56438 RepID=UPI00166FE286|nr:urease subunit beta [Couchioplanes caeruleus]GGQ48705.1 hypothetical protein GCM10010166_16260 [Couchioplanes caeruleus subsp. azureus]